MATTVSDYELSGWERDQAEEWQYQYSVDYFNTFFQGQPHRQTRARERIFEQFPIPYWDPPRPDPAFNWQFTDDYEPYPPRKRFAQHTRNDDGTGYTVDRAIEQQLNGLGLTLKRILGAGSQGLAVQFQYLDGQNFVMKWGTDLEAQVLEMLMLKELVGARHIIQVSLRLVPRPGGCGSVKSLHGLAHPCEICSILHWSPSIRTPDSVQKLVLCFSNGLTTNAS